MNNGIILVNKPSGYTSRDIVNIFQKKLQTKKIGHCGTLDPSAEGVLVLCVGTATKLVDYLTSSDKQYRAKMILGTLTTTCDLDGEVVKTENVSVSDSDIEAVFKSFPKSYIQQVPIYSAVKVKGKKLYEYARQNIPVELPSREVQINSLELIEVVHEGKTEIEFICDVSKGTYIRSLCLDLAAKLNTISVMSELTRTRQGEFTLSMCQSIDEDANIIDINEITFSYPRIDLTDIDDVKHGRKIINTYGVSGVVSLYYNNELIAFYESDGEYLKSKRGVKVWK